MTLAFKAARRALGLVELMVVIAVIAVLAGILLATLSGVSERSRNLKCVSNLRSIGIGLDLYIAEHGYYMGAYPTVGTFWYQMLEPWMTGHDYNPDSSSPSVWIQCPVRNQLAGEPTIGYGYNYLGFGHHSPESGRWDDGGEHMEKYWHVSPARIENPSRAIVIGDNHDPGGSGSVFLLYNAMSGAGFSRRHQGGANYLFADGHVESMTPEALAESLQSDNKGIMRPF